MTLWSSGIIPSIEPLAQLFRAILCYVSWPILDRPGPGPVRADVFHQEFDRWLLVRHDYDISIFVPALGDQFQHHYCSVVPGGRLLGTTTAFSFWCIFQ
jgi:hypothetical protein